MIKKIAIVLNIALISILVFACGNNNAVQNVDGESGATEEVALQKVTVACTPVPHSEIMNNIKDLMLEKGFELEILEFSDYVTPNLAVEEGDADANFFQHKPYLDEFNEERGTDIVSIVDVHYEPFGIYAGTSNTLEVANGAKIAVPNDVTNEARALNLLQDAGIITLAEGVGLKATKLDILENPFEVEIVELESAQIPRSLDSVDLACMNGNYAMEAGYKATDSLYLEEQDSDAANLYANIVCVKGGNENAEFAVALKECIKDNKVKKFINDKYEKSVIFID